MRLDPAATGTRLLHLGAAGSTNTEALLRARAGERGPLWVTATTQSEGRGRRGRSWVSDPGNLHASLLLTEPGPPARLPDLSFVAGLALHDAVAGRIPGLSARLSLKWPNDLLIDRCKFAGILVEAEGPFVAIGIGVNCLSHPSGTSFPATDLAAAGVRASAEAVFAALSAAMAAQLARWDRGAGFAVIRADWLARAASVGKAIRVTLSDREVAGVFETVDETGRLVLQLADGTMQALAAGDVEMAAR